MRTITIAAAALLAGGFTAASGIGHAAQAQAQTHAQTHARAPAQTAGARAVVVHFGDLDLGSAAGRRSLDTRIAHAIRSACGEASSADLQGRNAASACRSDLAASLTAQRDTIFASAAGGRHTTLVARRR